MNQHKASNGTSVHLDSNGRMTFRRDSPLCVNTLEAFWVQAAREYFQAERDEALGRWRDTENPDYVVYRSPEEDDDDGRCILPLNETTGVADREWERLTYSGPAIRYFAAHPKLKPWEAAQPDEVWALTINNDREEVFRCGERGLYSLKTGNPIGALLSCSHNKITAGRRIWPEGEDK